MGSNLFSRLITSYRKRGVFGVLGHAILDMSVSFNRWLARVRDHRGEFQISAPPKESRVLIVVLAGYKPAIWPLTLRRIKSFAPSDADICVVTAGKHVTSLATLCQQFGWSYASTTLNKTGLALNKVISAHPSAEWVFKIDEDIFVPENFFEDLQAGYLKIARQGTYNPGFCSPTLNVNGISYLTFVDRLGLRSDYRDVFQEERAACSGVRAHHDPQAALWLWRHSLPFDKTAKRFSESAVPVDTNAHLIGTRFSIGAILLQREFLDQIGGFRSTWRQGILGVDESGLCCACMESSRPMFYLDNVLAGHFSFYPQERAMIEALPELAAVDPATFSAAGGTP